MYYHFPYHIINAILERMYNIAIIIADYTKYLQELSQIIICLFLIFINQQNSYADQK